MFRSVVVALSASLCFGQAFPSESRLPSREEAKKILQAVSRSESPVTSGKATLTRVLAGKFSQPDSPELIADFDGHEPHALDFGGSVLLREVKGEWRFARYAAGFRSTQCRKFARTDRTDLLVCQGGHTAMGENSIYLFTYDWRQKSGAKAVLLQANANRAKFERFETADVNGDGLPDLGVTVQAGSTMKIQFLFDGKGFRISPAAAAAKRKLDALNRP